MPGMVINLFAGHSGASSGSIQCIPAEDVPRWWVFWCIWQERQLSMLPQPSRGPGSHWFPVLECVICADQYTQRHGSDQTGIGQHPSCLQGHLHVASEPWHSLPGSKGALQLSLSRSPSASLHCPAELLTELHSKPHQENNPDLTQHPSGGWVKNCCFPTLVWKAAHRGKQEGTSSTHFAAEGCWGSSALPHIFPSLPSHGASRAGMG